jgi:hypothetical protein
MAIFQPIWPKIDLVALFDATNRLILKKFLALILGQENPILSLGRQQFFN